MSVARFRLDRLLRVRSQLRSLRQIELQQAEGTRLRLIAERYTLDHARRQVLTDAADASARGTLDGATLGLARGYEAVIDDRVRQVDLQRVAADRDLAVRREAVAAERREERRLEHLAARHRERLEVEAALEAERLLDELTLARHARETEGNRG